MESLFFIRVAGLMILILGLSACAIATQTYLPDGSQGYSISCDGAGVGINVCYEKAGELCGAGGYDLIDREGQIVPYGVATASGGQAFISYGSFNTKSIMIHCRNQNKSK